MKIPPLWKKLLAAIGPGIITGASDDDPSGIATYSQVGAQTGYTMLWTMLLSFPFMGAIQEISARIGRVTGRGIASNIRRYYPRWLLYLVVLLLFVANTINLGADLGAMASSLQLVVGGSVHLYLIVFAFTSLALEILLPYNTYVFYLKWLTLVLFAYVATVFTLKISWAAMAKGAFLPSIPWNASSLTALIAVLGTTISPYLFFWQASEEAEEVRDRQHERPLKRSPGEAPGQLHRIRIETYMGMTFSNLVAFFIILTAAATLHQHGVVNIESASQAAEALKPLAGRFAFVLFALGIVGTGMLAIPVLAASAAFALGEALNWPVSLQCRPSRVRGFYAILASAVLLGFLFNFTHINPIKALYWTSVLNGIVAVPVIAVMMLITQNQKAMGDFTLPLYMRVMGWLTLVLMAAATLGLVLTWGH